MVVGIGTDVECASAGGGRPAVPHPRRRSRSIGVVMSSFATLGTSRVLGAIATAAEAEAYALTLVTVGAPEQSVMAEAFARLGERGVDGVVVLVEDHEMNWRDTRPGDDLPIVVVDSSPRPGYSAVDTDQAQGAALATEHLLELGHETVWHIAGPMHSFVAQRRERSWAATLVRHDRAVPLPVVGDWTAESGYRLGQVLCRDPGVTAVFAANDQMALGLLRALLEADRAVPGEVSVVGFDDMAEAACFWPPLTTVRQAFDELGRRVVRALVDEITGAGTGAVVALVPTTLVVRGSTARAPW